MGLATYDKKDGGRGYHSCVVVLGPIWLVSREKNFYHSCLNITYFLFPLCSFTRVVKQKLNFLVLYFKVISSIYYLFMNMYRAPFKMQHVCYLLCNYYMLGFVYNKTIHKGFCESRLFPSLRSIEHRENTMWIFLVWFWFTFYAVLFQSLSSFSVISSEICWGGNSVPITFLILSSRHDNRTRRIWGRFLAAPFLSPSYYPQGWLGTQMEIQ